VRDFTHHAQVDVWDNGACEHAPLSLGNLG
jgi:hypothetical protein